MTTKDQVIELAKQAGIPTYKGMNGAEYLHVEGVDVTDEIEALIKLVRNAALDELSDKLKQSGATLPAKQEHEGGNAVLTGVSIALVVIEEMKEPT